MIQKLKLSFFGGTGSVTGANFLLEEPVDGGVKILVDCGLIQGVQFADEENREPFPYNPSEIDFLLVTHAHMDHIGRIPKLVAEGFRGKIISTEETRVITGLMFEDALKIMDQEARIKGTLPIYDKKDADMALSLWGTVPYHKTFKLTDTIQIFLKDAGHILGSAMYEISINGKKIVFTGDLGNTPSPILRDTESISGADYLVMESVYGDRNHEGGEERRERLAEVLLDTIKRKGVLLIPAFSLEKTQVLLSEMNYLVESGKVPSIPVFLDSPLSIKVTEVYRTMIENFNDQAKKNIASGDDIFRFPNLLFTPTRSESEAIENFASPKVIIAGSGMSTGGRITEHERKHLGDSRNIILFVGYQSPGGLGRQIEEGMKSVVINGANVEVKAKVLSIKGYSSHKDLDHLVEFAETGSATLKKIFVVMGEPKSALFLVQRLRDYLGLDAVAPHSGESVEIEM